MLLNLIKIKREREIGRESTKYHHHGTYFTLIQGEASFKTVDGLPAGMLILIIIINVIIIIKNLEIGQLQGYIFVRFRWNSALLFSAI